MRDNEKEGRQLPTDSETQTEKNHGMMREKSTTNPLLTKQCMLCSFAATSSSSIQKCKRNNISPALHSRQDRDRERLSVQMTPSKQHIMSCTCPKSQGVPFCSSSFQHKNSNDSGPVTYTIAHSAISCWQRSTDRPPKGKETDERGKGRRRKEECKWSVCCCLPVTVSLPVICHF